MTDRTLRQLVGALLVGLLLWGTVTLLSNRGGARDDAAAVRPLGVLDRDSIQGIRLEWQGNSVELEREGDRWRANGFPTDSGTVEELLGALEGLTVESISATNPSNHARLGVSTDSTAVLSVEVGGASRTLYVGNTGARFGTTHVRLPDDDEVYLVAGGLRAHLVRPIDDWRDKRLVALDTAAVARVEVVRDGSGYAVVRGDSTWTVEGGGDAAPGVVPNLLTELADLQAAGFLSEGDSLASFGVGGTTRVFDGAGGLLAELQVGEGTSERWARVTGVETLYRLTLFRVDRIAPPRDRVLGPQD